MMVIDRTLTRLPVNAETLNVMEKSGVGRSIRRPFM
jgi:hypothetical protein